MKENLTRHDNTRYAFMLVAASLFAALVLFASSGQALAVTVPDEGMDMKDAKGGWEMTYYSGIPDSKYMFFQAAKGKKISSVKSSNVKVVSAKAVKSGKFLQVQAKKGGKAKVTYKYGKKTYKMTITVREYVCPVKSFKVGSRDFAKRCKNHSFIDARPHPSGKVNIKPAAGYKLKSIELVTDKNNYSTTKKINNGSTIKKGQGNELMVAFTKKKTGEEQWLYLYLGD